jgi:hypothetical protein
MIINDLEIYIFLPKTTKINTMKKFYQSLKNWSNANSGILTIITFLIAITPFNMINLYHINPIFESFLLFLNYKFEIHLYIVILLFLVGIIYFQRLKSKYRRKRITIGILAGTWKNEWDIGGIKGSEMSQITDNGKYLVNGEHLFDIVDFEYNENKRQIKFIKSSVRPDDFRKLVNIVRLINNDLLSGSENNYDIKYTRISN